MPVLAWRPCALRRRADPVGGLQGRVCWRLIRIGQAIFEQRTLARLAGPLAKIEEQARLGRTLKEFFYEVSGFAGAYANGKLTIAVRHNWVQVPWAPVGTIIDAAVTEKLTFNGRDGRPSERVTSVAVGAGLQWRQSWSWDDLGNAAMITYPACENATCTGRSGAALARTITNFHANGFLTNIREGTTNHGPPVTLGWRAAGKVWVEGG